MVRERDASAFEPWLDDTLNSGVQALNSGVQALKSFANGLKQDFEAVRKALSLVWNDSLLPDDKFSRYGKLTCIQGVVVDTTGDRLPKLISPIPMASVPL